MKKFSLLLAIVMLFSTVAMPSLAEETYVIPNPEIIWVEGTDTQAALSSTTKNIIEVDGLKFRDLNGNGSLDVYEDWRADIEDRITDLLSQLTLDEEVGLLMHANSGGTFSPLYPKTEAWMYSHEAEIEVNGTKYVPMWYLITEDHVNHYLDNNAGTPQEQTIYHNALQQIGEETRLGIPVTFSCDREWNTWGSMINMPYAAFGYAHDKELLVELVTMYAKEMKAIGYQMVLHPYGVELGGWYGEDPTLVSDMIAAEVKAIEEAGVDTCTKHYIARGGRTSFEAARSEAQLVDNWMVPWKAAIEAGTDFIMINEGAGLSNDVWVQFDKASMDYLRNDLGYEGVIMSDWPIILGGVNRGTVGGGKDISYMSVGELYTMMLEYGMDQFGEDSIGRGLDTSIPTNDASCNWPDTLIECVENGTCDVELIHTAARRILRAKFKCGLFENPYCDVDAALELIASDEYIKNQFELTSIYDIVAARNDKLNELDERLQVESTILMKNDDSILPLQEGTKVYVTGNVEKDIAQDAAAIANFASTVETMEEADVIVARVTAFDDATHYIAEDAQAAGKPLVLIADCVEPTAWTVDNSAAIVYTTYSAKTDHGSSMGEFFNRVRPEILADMLFGKQVPGGSLVFEIARTDKDALLDWGDLHYDTGVSTETRLYMSQLVRNNPTVALPNNLGDVLYTSDFGMTYGAAANISATTLVLPKAIDAESGAAVQAVQKAGEAFNISFILQNDGDDGCVNAEVYEGENLIASKFMALEAGQFRVVTIPLTLEAGTHEISVCGLTATVTVE